MQGGKKTIEKYFSCFFCVFKPDGVQTQSTLYTHFKGGLSLSLRFQLAQTSSAATTSQRDGEMEGLCRYTQQKLRP